MLGISLAKSCGPMLSIVLKERLEKVKPARVLLVGPGASELSLDGMAFDRLEEPMALSAKAAYDVVVCVQCFESLRSLRVVNQGGQLSVLKANSIVPLSPEQEKLVRGYLSIAGITLKKGARATVPVEAEDLLKKAKAALNPNGVILLLDFLSPEATKKIAASLGLKAASDRFSHFISRTPMGKLRVLNNHPSLALYPHPMKHSGANALLSKKLPSGAIVPFLDAENSFSMAEKALLEPFIGSMSSVFSGWSSLVLEKLSAAQKLNKVLSRREELSELYSTLDLLGYDVKDGFFEKAWFRTKQMLEIPADIPLFAVTLSVSGKGL